jgi:hypothetical protein
MLGCYFAAMVHHDSNNPAVIQNIYLVNIWINGKFGRIPVNHRDFAKVSLTNSKYALGVC